MTDSAVSGDGELGRDRLRGGGLSSRPLSAAVGLPLLRVVVGVLVPEPEDSAGRGGAERRWAERSARKTFASSGSSWFTTEKTRVWRNVRALIGGPSSHISRNLFMFKDIEREEEYQAYSLLLPDLIQCSPHDLFITWSVQQLQYVSALMTERKGIPNDFHTPKIIQPPLRISIRSRRLRRTRRRRPRLRLCIRRRRMWFGFMLLLVTPQPGITAVHVHEPRLGIIHDLMCVPRVRTYSIRLLLGQDLRPLAWEFGAVVSINPIWGFGLQDRRRGWSRASQSA